MMKSVVDMELPDMNLLVVGIHQVALEADNLMMAQVLPGLVAACKACPAPAELPSVVEPYLVGRHLDAVVAERMGQCLVAVDYRWVAGVVANLPLIQLG